MLRDYWTWKREASRFQIVPQRLKGQNYKPPKVWMSHIWFKFWIFTNHEKKRNVCRMPFLPNPETVCRNNTHSENLLDLKWRYWLLLVYFKLNFDTPIMGIPNFKSRKYLMISGREIAHSNKESLWRLRMEEVCLSDNRAYRCFKVSLTQVLISWDFWPRWSCS